MDVIIIIITIIFTYDLSFVDGALLVFDRKTVNNAVLVTDLLLGKLTLKTTDVDVFDKTRRWYHTRALQLSVNILDISWRRICFWNIDEM